jgi:AcrR family transcriptional regulator
LVQAGKKDLIYKSAKKLFNKYGIKKVSIDMIVNKA